MEGESPKEDKKAREKASQKEEGGKARTPGSKIRTRQPKERKRGRRSEHDESEYSGRLWTGAGGS